VPVPVDSDPALVGTAAGSAANIESK